MDIDKIRFVKYLTQGFPIHVPEELEEDFLNGLMSYINDSETDYWAQRANNIIVISSGNTRLLFVTLEQDRVWIKSFNNEEVDEDKASMGNMSLMCISFFTTFKKYVLCINDMPDNNKSYIVNNKKYEDDRCTP